MLDVRRLSVLCEVARSGSISAAATVLGYTQPAVSRQISVLESEVGVQLLRRLPQGVALTDAGQLLVDRAEAVILSLSRTEEELRARTNMASGTLRMAAFASSAASVVPLALGRFRDRHPEVELKVTVADPVESLPMLRAGELDLILSNHSPDAELARSRRPQQPGLPLDWIDLFDDPMHVALHPCDPLADVPELTLAHVADQTWMLASNDTCPDAELFLGACAQEGIEPKIAFQYDDYAALAGFVAAGVGLTVVPDMIARNLRDDVTVRPLTPPLPPRPIAAVIPSGYRTPAVAAMLEILEEIAPEWVAGQLIPAAVSA
jgi:DNA-binding transcriptional LysR family regulator